MDTSLTTTTTRPPNPYTVTICGPNHALMYAVQAMIAAGYSDEDILGRVDFVLGVERLIQEQPRDAD